MTMTMTETAKPLKSNAYVVTTNRGVDEWGFYFEFVELDAGTLSIIHKYCRVFVARNHLSFYERKAGTARTTWKPVTCVSSEAARERALKMLSRRAANVMRGSVILVQLEPGDVETIDRGKSPAARYRATARHQQLFGQLEVVADAIPKQFDFSGVQRAIEAIGTTAPGKVTTFSAPPVGAAATTLPPPTPVAEPDKSTSLTAGIDWTSVIDKEPY